jgi:hypothetical protein
VRGSGTGVKIGDGGLAGGEGGPQEAGKEEARDDERRQLLVQLGHLRVRQNEHEPHFSALACESLTAKSEVQRVKSEKERKRRQGSTEE